MGQRHQAYLRLPAVYYNENNSNNHGELTVGIHHQWLYGYSAVWALYRFLKWLKQDETNIKYLEYSAKGAFAAAYSFDHELGYYHNVHDLTDGETDNPLLGDNNNGITLVDFGDKVEPKYCFMSVGYLECLADGVAQPKLYEPMSVSDWLDI